ncbi:zinc-binding dehydrogenase [Kitasatospora sp. NPDC051170]|uniref:zinc-binding dehydrogenase n=1 Tax=Kitasatospora sp. NPDC051170 TaxID=3364056 RepID=UPI003790A992
MGSAGSRERAERLVAGFGYDAVAVRGAGPFAEQLAEAAPGGLDVVVDNVGGEQLAAAVALANPGARILVLGALSGQLAAHGTGRTAPVELDSFPLLLKKLSLRGYSADDDPDAEAEWYEHCARWRASGTVDVPLARVRGLENAPQALADTIAGRHLGTVIVELQGPTPAPAPTRPPRRRGGPRARPAA